MAIHVQFGQSVDRPVAVEGVRRMREKRVSVRNKISPPPDQFRGLHERDHGSEGRAAHIRFHALMEPGDRLEQQRSMSAQVDGGLRGCEPEPTSCGNACVATVSRDVRRLA